MDGRNFGLGGCFNVVLQHSTVRRYFIVVPREVFPHVTPGWLPLTEQDVAVQADRRCGVCSVHHGNFTYLSLVCVCV